MEDIYIKLRERLDNVSTGYPATPSGIELKILKRLFSEFFLNLSPLPETPEQAAVRLNRDAEGTAVLMEKMAKKGLLFRLRREKSVSYAAIPFLVGILEHQVNRLDPELARDLNEYFETAFGKTVQSFKTPVMRTIPINRQIAVAWPIAPYEDVLEIIKSQKTIAIAPCICRKWMAAVDKACDKPVETCFLSDRCIIGCGLCVTTCTTGALRLVKKPDDQQYRPPQSGVETYMKIALERGKNLMPS
jgi:electron transport complex protein RnfB